MKTYLIYTSRYGFTKDIMAELTQLLLGEVIEYDFANPWTFQLQPGDCVILGGSIYIGQLDKHLTQWISLHQTELLTTTIHLFLACGFMDQFEANMKRIFPTWMVEVAQGKYCLGGELRLDKMTTMHRWMTKVLIKDAQKKNQALPQRNERAINALISAVNQEYLHHEKKIA